MNIFDLDNALVKDYESFARSFIKIRASDIKGQLDNLYAGKHFWPDPLLTINPKFEAGKSETSPPTSRWPRKRSISLQTKILFLALRSAARGVYARVRLISESLRSQKKTNDE